jgi:uncharacterized membrane protein
MNVDVGGGPVEQYLAGVRTALGDLPAPEVEEVLEDVRGHLADVRAEVGAEVGDGGGVDALTARLGTPDAYAAELRAAAGYPPPPAAPDRSAPVAARVALWALVASTALVVLGLSGLVLGGESVVLLGLAVLVGLAALPALAEGGPRMAAVAGLPVVRRLRASVPGPDAPGGGLVAFLASLQPAWWVLRALVASTVVSAVVGTGTDVAWVVVAVVAVPVSVWVGRLSRRDRRALWVVVPLNALAAGLVPLVLFSLSTGVESGPQPGSPYLPGLWQDGERIITDIRPVDAYGNPLTGVYLFDQDGRPLDVGDPCEGESTGATGSLSYPRGTGEYDEDGGCVVVPPAPLVVAVPTPAPTPATIPTPTPAAPATPSAVPPTVPAAPTG